MYYVIQEDLFKEYNFRNLISHLERNKLEYEFVKFRPFGADLEVKTDRKDIWLFGAVNASMHASQLDWNPGSMYNENHNFEVYAPYYGKNMLNDDAIIINADQPLPDSVPKMFFARPAKDSKMFSGQVFMRDGWNEWIAEAKTNSSIGYITAESRIVIALDKYPIQQEVRCWIVNGEVVTASQYKIGNRVNMLNMDNNEEVVIFVRNMAKLYCPAKAFVMDICLYQDEYKVVEINCINASGFYDANMSKLIQSLENTFS